MRTPIITAVVTTLLLAPSMTLTSFAAPMSTPTPVAPAKTTPIIKKLKTKRIYKIERKKWTHP